MSILILDCIYFVKSFFKPSHFIYFHHSAVAPAFPKPVSFLSSPQTPFKPGNRQMVPPCLPQMAINNTGRTPYYIQLNKRYILLKRVKKVSYVSLNTK